MNPHALRRHPLKMVCLPIPPLPRVCDSIADSGAYGAAGAGVAGALDSGAGAADSPAGAVFGAASVAFGCAGVAAAFGASFAGVLPAAGAVAGAAGLDPLGGTIETFCLTPSGAPGNGWVDSGAAGTAFSPFNIELLLR